MITSVQIVVDVFESHVRRLRATDLECNEIAVFQIPAQANLHFKINIPPQLKTKQSLLSRQNQANLFLRKSNLAESALANELDGFKLTNACPLPTHTSALCLRARVRSQSSCNLCNCHNISLMV